MITVPYVSGIWKSQEMVAVFDTRRVNQRTIDSVESPYQIWNNPKLEGKNSRSPAYVLAKPYTPSQKEEHARRLEKIDSNPNLVRKPIFCGN